MLKYNIKRLTTNRSIQKPINYLHKHGFTYPTAKRVLFGTFASLKPAQIENLCIAFHCTPNDLFEYTADEKITTPNHPLTTLIRNQETKKVTELLNDIPLDMLPSFTNKLEELKKDLLKNN